MKPVKIVLLLFIKFYQWVISPMTRASCRFLPTCSAYALEAIDRFGPLEGSKLAIKRLCQCHPWGKTGFDPVPQNEKRGSRPQSSQ